MMMTQFASQLVGSIGQQSASSLMTHVMNGRSRLGSSSAGILSAFGGFGTDDDDDDNDNDDDDDDDDDEDGDYEEEEEEEEVEVDEDDEYEVEELEDEDGDEDDLANNIYFPRG